MLAIPPATRISRFSARGRPELRQTTTGSAALKAALYNGGKQLRPPMYNCALHNRVPARARASTHPRTTWLYFDPDDRRSRIYIISVNSSFDFTRAFDPRSVYALKQTQTEQINLIKSQKISKSYYYGENEIRELIALSFTQDTYRKMQDGVRGMAAPGGLKAAAEFARSFARKFPQGRFPCRISRPVCEADKNRGRAGIPAVLRERAHENRPSNADQR